MMEEAANEEQRVAQLQENTGKRKRKHSARPEEGENENEEERARQRLERGQPESAAADDASAAASGGKRRRQKEVPKSHPFRKEILEFRAKQEERARQQQVWSRPASEVLSERVSTALFFSCAWVGVAAVGLGRGEQGAREAAGRTEAQAQGDLPQAARAHEAVGCGQGAAGPHFQLQHLNPSYRPLCPGSGQPKLGNQIEHLLAKLQKKGGSSSR